MTLGKLIKFLERQDQEKVLRKSFLTPCSYRGYYEQLAFVEAENVKCADMLAAAKSALGETFGGYKGGEFKMDEYTDVWIVESPRYTGDGISLLLLRYMFNDWEPFEES